MKKAGIVILSAGCLFLILIIGVWIGRVTAGGHINVVAAPDVPDNVTVSSGKLDINQVDLQQLIDLPNIGETIALRILDYRETHGPFTSLDQLLLIEDIGEGRLKELKEYLFVGG